MSSDRVPSDEFKEYEQKVKTLNKQPAQDDMLTVSANPSTGAADGPIAPSLGFLPPLLVFLLS